MKKMKLKTSILTIGGAMFGAATAFTAEGQSLHDGEGSWFALLFYVINAAIFLAIIVHYARPAVQRLFADRAHEARARRDRAQAALAEAERAARDAIHLVESLADEKARLIKEMEAETAYQVKQIRDAAAEGAARILRDSQLTVAAVATDARRRVRAYLAGVAGAMARKLVQRNFKPEDQHRMLSGFVEKLTDEARV
jgi:F0F1-type ATP synthase membrane subunit b/b'